MSQDSPSEWHIPAGSLKIRHDEVHLWLVGLDLQPNVLLTLRRSLAAEELARAKRFVLDRDRRRFIVGRSALRSILSRYLDAKPACVRFTYGDRGKPRLAEDQRYPMPNAELCFNLSHSGDLALIAVALGRQLGVDLERLDPTVDRELLTRGSFTSQEREQLAELPESQRLRSFFEIWTRKEAFLKACGQGLSLPLRDVEVSHLPGEPAKLHTTAHDGSAPAGWSLHDVRVDEDHAAALVLEGRDCRLLHWSWSPSLAS